MPSTAAERHPDIDTRSAMGAHVRRELKHQFLKATDDDYEAPGRLWQAEERAGNLHYTCVKNGREHWSMTQGTFDSHSQRCQRKHFVKVLNQDDMSTVMHDFRFGKIQTLPRPQVVAEAHKGSSFNHDGHPMSRLEWCYVCSEKQADAKAVTRHATTCKGQTLAQRAAAAKARKKATRQEKAKNARIAK